MSNFAPILLGGCNKVAVKISGQNNINAGTQIVIISVDQTIVAKVNTDGYLVTPGIGAHKLRTDSLTWNDARQACVQEGGKENNSHVTPLT